MNFKCTILTTALSIILFNSASYAQKVYVNQEWEDATGTVGLIQRTASAVDNNKNLIVVGNTMNASNNSDVLITKYSPEGVILWQQTYDGTAHGNDYGVQLKVNNSNEIFIVATLQESTNLDFGVLKYDSNGNLIWVNTWNGQANGIDIPADIGIDNNGNVYLVGGTEAPNGLSDYAVVKFNSNGVYQWHTTYDYTNLHDAAVSLTFIGNNLMVAGTSASTPTNWDYATLLINNVNGSILQTKRTTISGVGLDNVTAVISDNNNNTYITGYVEDNGNRDIQTLKIDENFVLAWVKNFDGGFEDIAKSIGIDDFGNIYVAGTKGNVNGGKDFITIKYDQNGTEIWNKTFGSGSNGNLKANAEHLAVKQNGEVLITGTIENGSHKEFSTIKYGADGSLKFVEKFDAGQHINEAKNIVVTDNDIYVTGITNTNGIMQNTTVKYSTVDRKIIPRIINGEEAYVQNDILIKFNKSYLNLPAIDRKSFVAGELNQFIKPELLQKLNDSTNYNWDNLLTYKIHKGATSKDTLSYTRLGDTISIEPFWNSLIVKISDKFREQEIIERLSHIDGIENAQLNYIYKTNSVPNDSAYVNGYQLGLHPNNTYPNSDINVAGAWNILENKGYSVGSENVKVGVFDYLIDYNHAEFSGSNGVNGSRIKYGKNYFNGNTIEDEPYLEQGLSHGTEVAGIIAANRNNGIGIAGIAGGNLDPNSPKNGVELYSLGIFGNYSTTSDLLIEALLESSLATNTGYGNGINIANHSYGSNDPFMPNGGGFDNEVRLAFEKSWRNGTINIVARGNKGQTNNPEYPACYDDKFLINVIASGTDGKRKTSNNGDTQDWESSYGKDGGSGIAGCFVDVMAPGVLELVSTTVNTDHWYISPYETSTEFINNCKIPLSDQDGNLYSCFGGTSAAAPHVTGVAALMYNAHDPVNNSYYKNKLTTEDIEHILEKTTFKTPNVYDNEDGYGLVNAEEAVRQVVLPYSVHHLNLKLSNATSITQEGVFQSTNPKIRILKTSTWPNSGVQQVGGPFTKKIRYKVKWNINYSPNDSQIIDWWKIDARTFGGQPINSLNSTDHYIMGNNNFYISNSNSSSVLNGVLNIDTINNIVTGTVEAYYYKFINEDPNNYYEQTLPSNPNIDIQYTIALHLRGDADLSVHEKEKSDNIIIYPNPSNTEITIKNLPDFVNNYELRIYNTSGVLVDLKKVNQTAEKIDVSHLSNGIYIFQLETNNYISTSKFIKQ